jgi:hypothetical protein
MSGEQPPRPARPIEVTDDDVEQLAGDRAGRVASVARLKKLVPSGPTGKLITRASVPAPISAREMDALRVDEQPPDRVRNRMTESPSAAEPTEDDPLLVRPTEAPPKGRAAATKR